MARTYKQNRKIATLEARKNMSSAQKGNTNGFKKGCISYNKGKHLSTETKEKIRLSKLGDKNPMYGKHLSKEHKEKLAKAHMGDKAYNYKGASSFEHLERRRFQNAMQKAVFERDNYTCQLCEVRGVDLQVDHIQEWSKYVELRFSMDNCRTLCAKCHYQITFGKPMPPTVRAWGHNFLKGGN